MMKRIILFFSIALSILFIQACNNGTETKSSEIKSEIDKDAIAEKDVPASVKSQFNTRYSNATEVKWEHAKEDNQPTIKAKFKMDGKEMEAEFKEDGSFIKEKVE
jgi:hypothetical protein